MPRRRDCRKSDGSCVLSLFDETVLVVENGMVVGISSSSSSFVL